MIYKAIVLKDHVTSFLGFDALAASTSDIEPFDAITPDEVKGYMKRFGLTWRYPNRNRRTDIATGLRLSPYPTKDPAKRIACALSHYMLWRECSDSGEPMVILEHDAIFLREIDFDISTTSFQIIGLNDPRGATRLSQKFHEEVQKKRPDKFTPAPWIDDPMVPQGIAGNSAYIITPEGADRMIALVNEHGLWPNDAIMCKQLVSRLAVTTQYYTKVQGLQSTTSN